LGPEVLLEGGRIVDPEDEGVAGDGDLVPALLNFFFFVANEDAK
jgi:hypothetical protein